MTKEQLHSTLLFKYLNWLKMRIDLGVDIEDVLQMKVFLMGYEKGLLDGAMISNDDSRVKVVEQVDIHKWLAGLQLFADRVLIDENGMSPSISWAEYLKSEKSNKEGLVKFYEILDRYIDDLPY